MRTRTEIENDDIAELRACLGVLAKIGDGITTAFGGINDLLVIGAKTLQRADAILTKFDESQAARGIDTQQPAELRPGNQPGSTGRTP